MTTRVLWGVAAGAALLLAVGVRLDVGANDGAPMPVLVAKQLIPTRTPGERIFAREMYERTAIPLRQIEDGAIADPGYLCGRVTVNDVLPGEQLTAASFRPKEKQKINSFGYGTPRLLANGVWVDWRGRVLRPPCTPSIR